MSYISVNKIQNELEQHFYQVCLILMKCSYKIKKKRNICLNEALRKKKQEYDQLKQFYDSKLAAELQSCKVFCFFSTIIMKKQKRKIGGVNNQRFLTSSATKKHNNSGLK